MRRIRFCLWLSLAFACQDQTSNHAPGKASQAASNSAVSPGSVRIDDSVAANDQTAASPSTETPQDSKGETTPPAPPAAASATPDGCTGSSTVAANDFVLYQGEAVVAPASNVINLTQGWQANEVWDNGRLQVEPLGTGTSISFSNEGIYHGFKFTPPAANGIRKNFTLTGAEVYVELKRTNPNAALPTFGLRVIKPNEFEGNGGAPTTTWMMDKPANGSRFLTAKTACTLIPMAIPQTFLDQKAVGNRLIWEMQSNWNAPDKIVIRKIVLKGFQLVP